MDSEDDNDDEFCYLEVATNCSRPTYESELCKCLNMFWNVCLFRGVLGEHKTYYTHILSLCFNGLVFFVNQIDTCDELMTKHKS